MSTVWLNCFQITIFYLFYFIESLLEINVYSLVIRFVAVDIKFKYGFNKISKFVFVGPYVHCASEIVLIMANGP